MAEANRGKLKQRGIDLASFIVGEWAASPTGLAWLINYLHVMHLGVADITTQMLNDLANWVPHGKLCVFRLVATSPDDMGRTAPQLACYLDGVGKVDFPISWRAPHQKGWRGGALLEIVKWERSAEELGGRSYSGDGRFTGGISNLSLVLNNEELDILENQGMVEIVLNPPNGGHLWHCDCGAVFEDIRPPAGKCQMAIVMNSV
jgi:hypothetical protein